MSLCCNKLKVPVSVETEVVVQASCYAHSEDTNHSIPISSEIDGSNNQVLITPDQAMEEIRENEGGAGMVDEVVAAELGYTGKDPTLYVSIEEPKLGFFIPSGTRCRCQKCILR